MIFRSNNEDDTPSPPSRETGMVLTSPITIPKDARSEDEVVYVGSNRLSALKRKLFPSRKRRHPLRIPPLIVSPITANQCSHIHDGVSIHSLMSQNESTHTGGLHASESVMAREQELPEEDFDFDDELVNAIEAADRLQSATSDETLAEMTHVIDGLLQWKQAHELATATALTAMEEEQRRELAGVTNALEDNADESALVEEAQRNQRLAELAREQLMETLKETEKSLASEHSPDPQVVRVLLEAERQAAHDHDDHVNNAQSLLLKLRGDVFDLGVKELSSTIHAALLKELSDVDNELDMKYSDVEALASDLDNVLAQLDAASASEGHQNPAGQAAQEH